jgi:DNA mismatch repair protein MutS2
MEPSLLYRSGFIHLVAIEREENTMTNSGMDTSSRRRRRQSTTCSAFTLLHSLSVVLLTLRTCSGFLPPSCSSISISRPFRSSDPLWDVNNKDDNDQNGLSTLTRLELEDKNDARAGKDGYSLLRQPLMKDSWDPNKDPTFDAPRTIEEQDVQAQNMQWWSNKQKQQEQLQEKKKKQSTSQSSYWSSTTTISTGTETSPRESPSSESSSAPPLLDLFQRSLDTLDFPFVLKALRNECFTSPAKRMVEEALHSPSSSSDNNKSSKLLPPNRAYQPLTAETPQGVQERYDAVQEMQWLLDDMMDLGEAYYKNRRGYQVTLGNGNPPPLDGLNFDLDSILQMVQDGQILEGPELLDVSIMMNAMEDLQLWSLGLQRIFSEEQDHHHSPYPEFTALPQLVEDIQLNATLQTLLEDAFDDDGKLSGTTFPILGQLRAKVRSLKADILQTLDALVSMPSIKSKLALEGGGPLYSEISNGGGRLVLPMDPKYASQIGIVHDSSRSGKTVYVEPSEVVGPTNELRQTEGELKAEEARVWRSLTEQVWTNRQDLDQSVKAVGQLDLVLARTLLGKKLRGVIPVVKDEGVISLHNAQHPVLLLREIENVVGSDIDFGANGNQGLVLTGPNSGGKTVILKLLGLVALMTRSGIPVPATAADGKDSDYQPRVDFFNPVLADIGDIQSVGGDLSTFSGHMLVCREVLANSGRNALVLMDELGSGTDPAQGVAIAQALLEALLGTGCRVAITTHYMALKQLAASDDRFSVGGMQFVKGRPTYKLLPGTVGESFAIAVAERLKLPQPVIDRANELLDSETRQMGDLILDLENQKAVIDDQVEELEAKKREMAQLEFQMKEEQLRLEKKMLTARRDEARKFAKKLEEKELILENVLEKLKSDPNRKILAKSWEDIKFVKRDALNDAENIPSVIRAKMKAAAAAEGVRAELVPLAEMRDKPEIKEGDKLIVCKPGSLFGREAEVVKDLGKQIQVRISGVTMALKLKDLSPVLSGKITPKPFQSSAKTKKQKLSKSAEKALQSEGSIKRDSSPPADSPPKKSVAIRTDSNTVDVRGCYFEEAKDKVKEQISKCIMSGQNVVYVLHGHGTGGVLKSKVRGWLKSERQLVKRWSPAERDDGGDAFTRLEVR